MPKGSSRAPKGNTRPLRSVTEPSSSLAWDTYYLETNTKSMRNRLRWESTSLPPQLHAQIIELVNDPRFPHRSVSDFVRDACFHRMSILKEKVDSTDVTNHPVFLAAEIAAIGREAEMWEELVEDVRVQLGSSAGDRFRRDAILVKANSILASMPEHYQPGLQQVLNQYSS